MSVRFDAALAASVQAATRDLVKPTDAVTPLKVRNPRAPSRLVLTPGGVTAKQRSILEKFSDTVKGIADSASQALKPEEPARIDETTAAYMPFAAEGLVSDPLLLPVATPPPRRKRTAEKAAGRRATRSAKKSTPKKSTKKSARKTARKSASAKSKQVTKTTKRSAGARKAARERGRR